MKIKAISVGIISLILVCGFWVTSKASSEEVTVCIKNNGLIYAIGEGFKKTDCKTNDSLLTLGAQGAQGPKGDTGPQGPAGSISGTEIVTNQVTNTVTLGQESRLTAEVSCPNGKLLLGGGARATYTDINEPDRGVALTESYPLDASTWKAVGTSIGIRSLLPGEMTVTAYAVCSE